MQSQKAYWNQKKTLLEPKKNRVTRTKALVKLKKGFNNLERLDKV